MGDGRCAMTAMPAPDMAHNARPQPARAGAPLVSVGVPVYNGERTIRQALQSILAQSHENLELCISDNASTDGTREICEEFARRDARIRYHRQERNLGAAANFKYVLDQACGSYFMWAAADDVRSPDFVTSNLRFLEQHPDFVLSTSPTRFEDGAFDPIRVGDASLDGTLDERMCNFFRKWHANGRFYGLMRRAPLLSCPVMDAHFLGADWAIVLHMAGQGKTHRLEQGWTVLGARGASRSKDIFRIYRTHVLDVFVPFRHLSRFVWGRASTLAPAHKAQLFFRLLRLNAMAFVVQFLIRWR